MLSPNRVKDCACCATTIKREERKSEQTLHGIEKSINFRAKIR